MTDRTGVERTASDLAIEAAAKTAVATVVGTLEADRRRRAEMDAQEPQVGVAVKVELRATVQSNGVVLWSADAHVADGHSYVGNGPTPVAACDELSRVLAFHAAPRLWFLP